MYSATKIVSVKTSIRVNFPIPIYLSINISISISISIYSWFYIYIKPWLEVLYVNIYYINTIYIQNSGNICILISRIKLNEQNKSIWPTSSQTWGGTKMPIFHMDFCFSFFFFLIISFYVWQTSIPHIFLCMVNFYTYSNILAVIKPFLNSTLLRSTSVCEDLKYKLYIFTSSSYIFLCKYKNICCLGTYAEPNVLRKKICVCF